MPVYLLTDVGDKIYKEPASHFSHLNYMLHGGENSLLKSEKCVTCMSIQLGSWNCSSGIATYIYAKEIAISQNPVIRSIFNPLPNQFLAEMWTTS